jgi:glycosyltransferase involved in cell wall biosynthesis
VDDDFRTVEQEGDRGAARLMVTAGPTPGISLTCVVPCFNEAEILDDTLRIFVNDLSSLRGIVDDFEIVVVDDGSTDGTLAIAERWAANDRRVRVVRHDRNQGVGAGILTGIQSATKEWLTVNCADRPFSNADIATFGSLFERADVVVVERADRSANSPYRKLTSMVNYALIRVLFRIPVADCQFAQFYRTSRVREYRLLSKGSMVPPELILRAAREGARLARVVLRFHPRPGGVAKYGHPKHALKAVVEMAQLRWALWHESRAERRRATLTSN